MSIELRTRAALAVLDLFGFNPHQLRGPDGRFIKMPDNQLKRPRRPRKSGVKQPKTARPDADRAAWRANRDSYNASVLDYAEKHAQRLADKGLESSLLADKVENIRALRPDDPDLDVEIDELRGTMVNYYGHKPELSEPPAPPGLRRVAVAEDPLYRRRRDTYNGQVLADAQEQRAAYADPTMYPEIDEAANATGAERDAIVDRLAERLNQRAVEPGEGWKPPTRSGPAYVGERTATRERPAFTAPYDQRRQALQASIDSGAVDEATLAQGAMGETRRFDLADGTSTVYKRQTRDWDRGWDWPTWTKADQTDAEELSAITAAALGVAAPSVVRAGPEEIYMDLMPGTIGEERWPHRGGVPPQGVVRGQQGARMGLLDTLIENSDRHGGNYLVDEDDNLYAIDHGMAFGRTYELREGGPQRRADQRVRTTGDFALQNYISPSGNYYDTNPLTRADGERLKAAMLGLRQQFVDMGRLGWWEAMNERALHLAARASGDEDIL